MSTGNKYKKIVAIVGRSGSGKTEIAKALIKKGAFVVCSNTTRDQREGEVDGIAPYYNFKKIDDYIRDNTVTGMIMSGNLGRGDDIILADTVYGDKTYWTNVSDVLNDNDIVFYVIDPEGVRSLHNLKIKVADRVRQHKWTEDQVPNLYAFLNSRTILVYVNGSNEVYSQVSDDRKARDAEQDLGWDLCKIFAYAHIDNEFIPDITERQEQMGHMVSRIQYMVGGV